MAADVLAAISVFNFIFDLQIRRCFPGSYSTVTDLARLRG